MKKTFFALALMAALPVFAQYSDESVLLTIGTKEVTTGEFTRIYTKNNPNAQFDSASIASYLPMFIDYKLKVIEAEALKMDTLPEFKEELNGYRVQLEKPYFTDTAVDEALYREIYNHMLSDVKASHILVMCSEDATPADSIKAYKKIQNIYKRAIKGADFNKLAAEVSEDPSAKRNSGDLGYFTAFSMINEFENQAYNTPIGQISKPFRTRVGYHILKVEDERPSRGQVKVSHILVRSNARMSEADAQAAEKKIFMISDSLAKGADWKTMVARYSEDRGTASQGGDLQWFGTMAMVPEFEDAAFALQTKGEISKPIKTPYGWHIIKLVGKRPIAPYADAKNEIRRRVSGDARSQLATKVVCEKLKKEYNFGEDKNAFNEIAALVDSTILQGSWNANKAEGYNKPLFWFADLKYTQHDFARVLARVRASRNKISVTRTIQNEYDKLVQTAIFRFERTQLEKKYPDFRYLLQEYHDGILLFSLTDKMVWSKALTDTIGLTEYYNANIQNYMWDNRLEVVSCSYKTEALANKTDKNKIDAKLLSALKKGVKKGDYLNQVKIVLQKSGIEPDSIPLKVADKKYSKTDNIVVDNLEWKKGVTQIVEDQNLTTIYYVVAPIASMPKTLDECRGTVASDYQTVLEAKWIAELRAKYPVKLNNDVFKSLLK